MTTNWVPIIRQFAPNAAPAIFNPFVAGLPAAFNEAVIVTEGKGKDEKKVPYKISTPRRQAHLLAHVFHESAHLKATTENLNYSADGIRNTFKKLAGRAEQLARNPQALANAAYANRYGNGDEASGDGWRYRGRSFFQHTFKGNYQELSDWLGVDLVRDPDRLASDHALGLRAAVFYFIKRGCIPFADMDNIVGTTKIINGGANGLAERRAMKDKLLRLLGGK